MAAIVTSEGATDIEYWSVDRAGNEETPHKKAAFKVDTTPPVTTSNAKPTYYGSASIGLIRSDGGISGIATTEWQLDASTWTSGTVIDVTELGTHTLRFRSTDVAGNREGTRVWTFTIVPLAITPTAGAGGSISPGTVQTVKPGASSTFTVTPKSGYRISNVKVDGVSKGAIAVYTFSDVVVSHTITASFAATSTSISLSTRSNSSLGYKMTFQVGGHFKVGSAGTAKQRVILQSRAPGEMFTDTSQRATTGTGGRFTFSVQPSATTHYRVRFAAANGYGGSHAPTSVYAKPRVRVTRSTSWMSLSRSKKYYSRGFISPRHANADSNKIRIRAYKRGVHGRYYYVKSFMASYAYFNSARTEYKAAVRLTSRGTWKLVAYHASDTNNAKTYGSADYVRVY